MADIFIAEDILHQIYSDVERRFTGIDDLAHGWEHVERVYRLSLMIADRENANRMIVGIAALLHDLGRSVPAEENNHQAHHADLSVSLARDLMREYHIPNNEQEAILHAIIAHSFSRGVEPQTIEAKIVRDADRLDGLGAIGILRWAVTGAVRRTPETCSYHPTDPFGTNHPLQDQRYMLDHFYSKLLKLSATMLTETGHELAKQRTDFMHSYLAQFRHELADLATIPM
ncbi:MAG TPA: HD domain-containing protein [Ktedonobacteraceae bacterium]|jgi:uncharacterized protein|nr:HD domain-containing protein [Ktedonobacteraceae bacterium]